MRRGDGADGRERRRRRTASLCRRRRGRQERLDGGQRQKGPELLGPREPRQNRVCRRTMRRIRRRRVRRRRRRDDPARGRLHRADERRLGQLPQLRDVEVGGPRVPVSASSLARRSQQQRVLDTGLPLGAPAKEGLERGGVDPAAEDREERGPRGASAPASSARLACPLRGGGEGAVANERRGRCRVGEAHVQGVREVRRGRKRRRRRRRRGKRRGRRRGGRRRRGRSRCCCPSGLSLSFSFSLARRRRRRLPRERAEGPGGQVLRRPELVEHGVCVLVRVDLVLENLRERKREEEVERDIGVWERDSVFSRSTRCSKLGSTFSYPLTAPSSRPFFCPEGRSLTLSSITSSATFGAAAEEADGEGAPADPASVADAISPLRLLVALNCCPRSGLRAAAIADAEGDGRRGAPMPSERARCWRVAGGETAGAALLLAVPESMVSVFFCFKFLSLSSLLSLFSL